MGIGDTQPLERALDAAILAPAAMQGIEGAIGFRLEKLRGRIFGRIDLNDIEALFAQRLCTARSRRKAYLAFRRAAAQQHSNTVVRRHGMPTRLISHSSSIPNFAPTCARTSSPNISRSAAVASPALMRKLQCISETCAPPRRKPRPP